MQRVSSFWWRSTFLAGWIGRTDPSGRCQETHGWRVHPMQYKSAANLRPPLRRNWDMLLGTNSRRPGMPSTAHRTASPCHHAASGTCAHPPCNPEHHVEWPARAPVISGRPCRQQPHQHASNACGQAASANAKRQISRGRIRAPPPPPRVTHAMPPCFCAATKCSCSRQPRTPHRSHLTAVPAAVGMPSQD
jgi:hypothetical protein